MGISLLACSWRLAKSTLSLFRHYDRFDFVFSLGCIDWVRKQLCEPNFLCVSFDLLAFWPHCLGKRELAFVLILYIAMHTSLFLFLLVSGVGCDFCLWVFLDFSVYLFHLEVFGIPDWINSTSSLLEKTDWNCLLSIFAFSAGWEKSLPSFFKEEPPTLPLILCWTYAQNLLISIYWFSCGLGVTKFYIIQVSPAYVLLYLMFDVYIIAWS